MAQRIGWWVSVLVALAVASSWSWIPVDLSADQGGSDGGLLPRVPRAVAAPV